MNYTICFAEEATPKQACSTCGNCYLQHIRLLSAQSQAAYLRCSCHKPLEPRLSLCCHLTNALLLNNRHSRLGHTSTTTVSNCADCDHAPLRGLMLGALAQGAATAEHDQPNLLCKDAPNTTEHLTTAEIGGVKYIMFANGCTACPWYCCN